jgi:hypothetical protein
MEVEDETNLNMTADLKWGEVITWIIYLIFSMNRKKTVSNLLLQDKLVTKIFTHNFRH